MEEELTLLDKEMLKRNNTLAILVPINELLSLQVAALTHAIRRSHGAVQMPTLAGPEGDEKQLADLKHRLLEVASGTYALQKRKADLEASKRAAQDAMRSKKKEKRARAERR